MFFKKKTLQAKPVLDSIYYEDSANSSAQGAEQLSSKGHFGNNFYRKEGVRPSKFFDATLSSRAEYFYNDRDTVHLLSQIVDLETLNNFSLIYKHLFNISSNKEITN